MARRLAVQIAVGVGFSCAGTFALAEGTGSLGQSVVRARESAVSVQVLAQDIAALAAADLSELLLDAVELGDELRRGELEILIGEVGSLGREPVLSSAGASLDLDDDGARELYLSLVGEVGLACDLDLLLDIVVWNEVGPGRSEARHLEQVAGRLFVRESGTYKRFRALLLDQPPRVQSSLVKASLNGDPEAGIEALFELLGYTAEVDTLLLEAIAVWSGKCPEHFATTQVERLRYLLDENDEARAREVALTLGRLEDYQVLPDLIELLDGSPTLRPAIHRALQEMTALSFPADSVRWRAWYEGERAWLDSAAVEVLDTLAFGEGAQVFAALQEVSQHRCERPRLAAAVQEVLDRPEPELRAAACAVLKVLGGAEQVERLLEAAREREPAVADAALAAIESITKTALNADPATWSEQLGVR